MRPIWAPVLLALFACQTLSPIPNSTQPNQRQPIRSVLDAPVEFTGPRGEAAAGSGLDEIRIGLFAPISSGHLVGNSVFRGATLAIERFNSAGGLAGIPVHLSQRWDDDPWRGGSKEMTKLVYADSVWAVIGSVDGAATHVAEQVVTKAWLPLLSPVSADPTLNYIRIPWMFRLPPDDGKQAAILVSDGINAHALSNVGLITSTDHDGRIFAAAMLEQMASARISPIFHLQITVAEADLTETNRHSSSFNPDGVIVRLPRDRILALLDSFEATGSRVPVLIPWVPGLLPSDLRGRYRGNIWFVRPFSVVNNQVFVLFANEFRERFGTEPTPSAAYAFDAVNVLVKAIGEVGVGGLSRANLREAIAEASGYLGATGAVRWDNVGANQTEPVLVEIRGAAQLEGAHHTHRSVRP